MDGVMGPSEAEIVQWGAMADTALDVFVAAQGDTPNNFKALTDVLMSPETHMNGRREFFLAITLATAIIRLAAIEGASK